MEYGFHYNNDATITQTSTFVSTQAFFQLPKLFYIFNWGESKVISGAEKGYEREGRRLIIGTLTAQIRGTKMDVISSLEERLKWFEV